MQGMQGRGQKRMQGDVEEEDVRRAEEDAGGGGVQVQRGSWRRRRGMVFDLTRYCMLHGYFCFMGVIASNIHWHGTNSNNVFSARFKSTETREGQIRLKYGTNEWHLNAKKKM